MLTLTEPAVLSLRNMSPAFDQPEPGSLFCKVSTRAIIVPSPVQLVLQELNWSAVFQMSEPPPVTVHKPLVQPAEPAKPGEPMSASLHPGGKYPEFVFRLNVTSNTASKLWLLPKVTVPPPGRK